MISKNKYKRKIKEKESSFQRLSIPLAQINTSKASENLLNEIRQMI